jgi:PAS domain-containing protein
MRLTGMDPPASDCKASREQSCRSPEQKIDAVGRVVRMNPVAEQFTGWSETEGLGRPLLQVYRIMSEETRAEVPIPRERVRHEGMPAGRNHRHLPAAA